MMKQKIASITMVVLFGVAPWAVAAQDAAQESGKTTGHEVRQEVTDAAAAIRNYSADQRDEAARKVKAALDALDARIADLEAQVDRNWDKMDQAARQRTRDDLKELHAQRIQVAEWYGGLKNSSASAWVHMKQGFSEAYGSLRRAWEKTERDFRHAGRK